MNAIADAVFVVYLLSVVSLLGLLMTLLVGARSAARNFIVLLIVFLGYIVPLFAAQFAFTYHHRTAEVLIRTSLFFAGLTLPVLYIFLKQRIKGFRSSVLAILSYFTLLIGLLSISPAAVKFHFIVSKEGIGFSDANLVYNLLILSVLAGFLISAITLYALYRKHGETDAVHQQAIALIRNSFILALGLNILGAFLARYTWSQIFAPVSITVLGIMMYVAIFKHQLFDVRPVIARSIAYLLSVFSICAAYALIAFLLIDRFIFPSSTLSVAQAVTFTLLAVFLTFTLQPIRVFFNRFTNTLFYRDAYDPQQLLDRLNAVLVSNIEINTLLAKSSAVIGFNIKAKFCAFGIEPDRQQAMRIFNNHGLSFSEDDLAQLKRALGKARHNVIAQNQDSEIDGLMQRNSVSLIAKLSTHNTHLGYLFLGEKKSGSPYSAADVKIMDIVADDLAIAIQNALRFEEIQRFNITLQERVEEATRELRRVNARLRELDKTKDEFISMASHQLRTPLTTVKGYLSMLLDGDMGPVKKPQKEVMQRAFDGANRMVYLIADLLNVSRLQTGKFVIDNKPTNLAEVIDGELLQLKEQAANRSITLDYKKPEHFPTLSLDETKIRQVVMNFLDNALYYTPRGGKVTAALAANDKQISYTVTDTGLGVPREDQHHLFSKFYRADNAKKMRPDGTGLGLYMAKKVIAAQGGAIIFKSTEGKGSTFGFSFPRKSMEIKGAAEDVKPSAGEAPANPAPAKKKTARKKPALKK